MKTLVKTIAIALFSVVSVATFANNEANNPTKTQNFKVGMYQTINTLRMNVLVEKVVGKKLTVTLKDAQGKVLSQEIIAKGSDSYFGKFDMSNLSDGKYTFEITDGTEKIVKQVNLETTTPAESTRTIELN